MVAIKPRYIFSDRGNDTLRGRVSISLGNEMAGSAHKLGEELRSLAGLQHPNPQPKLAEGMHEVFIGIGRHLKNATAAIETIEGQLLALEQQTERRSPEGFARYVLATCVGVAAILAWHSYSESAKQRLASAVQTAPENVTPKAPVAPSVDPEQVHQIASSVAARRKTIEQIAAGQDQMAHVVDKLQGAVAEILVKMPEHPPPPPVAAAVPAPKPVAAVMPAPKPVAAVMPAPKPKPKPKPTAPPWSPAPMQRYGSPYQ
jgi:hypothetical protein